MSYMYCNKDKVVSELEQQKVLYDKAEKEKSEYKKRIAQLEAKVCECRKIIHSNLYCNTFT